MATATGELQRLRPVACALAELAWLRDDGDAVDEVTREPYALAREVGHDWDVGELASWRWRAGVLDDAPDCAEPHRLLIAGEPAGRRRVLARHRRPLPGRPLPRRHATTRTRSPRR